MFWFDLIVALLIAFLISTLFVAFLGWRRPGEESGAADAAGGTALFFFLILFLATWAGGVWLYPFGPVFWGGYLLPFLFVGFIVALVLAAAVPTSEERWRWRRSSMAGMTPPRNPPPPSPTGSPAAAATLTPEQAAAAEREEAAALAGFGAFFWMLVIVLGGAIFLAYLF